MTPLTSPATTSPKKYTSHSKKRKVINSLLDTGFGSVGVYDLVNHRMIAAQWRVARRLGYARADYARVSNNFFRAILHPDDIVAVDRQLRALRKAPQGKVFRMLIRLLDTQGDYHLIAVRHSVLRCAETGQVCEVIGSLVDITDYSKLKDAVKDYSATMDELAFRTAHELRAPVATLLGLMGMVRHDLESHNIEPMIVDAVEQTVLNMDKTIHEFSAKLEKSRQA